MAVAVQWCGKSVAARIGHMVTSFDLSQILSAQAYYNGNNYKNGAFVKSFALKRLNI